MEFLLLMTPWLAVLACPLMMLVMMRLMPGARCRQKPQGVRGHNDSTEQIRQLQGRLAELEANVQTTGRER